MRMPHIVISGLPHITIFFYIISQTAGLKKKLLDTKCLLTFCTNLPWNILILRRTGRDTIKNVHSSDFNETWTRSTDFRKILKYQISWKSVQWEPSCSMRADKHDEANSRFSQVCERAWKLVQSTYVTTLQNVKALNLHLKHFWREKTVEK
jgi:hypothetical protein